MLQWGTLSFNHHAMMSKSMCGLHKVTGLLVFIGALNWGLVGVGGFLGSNWNVVNLILGSWPTVEWIVYVLVGLSALAMLGHAKCCGSCEK